MSITLSKTNVNCSRYLCNFDVILFVNIVDLLCMYMTLLRYRVSELKPQKAEKQYFIDSEPKRGVISSKIDRLAAI